MHQKTKMPELAPDIRNKNFNEVSLGYTEEMAMAEARRCLNCKKALCIEGCPVNVQIPEFIQQISAGEFEAAYQTISQSNSLPAVCGRVCPQETQCEVKCIRGIKQEPVAIGRLERFAADYHISHSQGELKKPEPQGHKVAIVGAGPSGLSCAYDLTKLGYEVDIFEAFHTAGGVLVYGIPEFRLPKSIVEKEINNLKALGVKIHLNVIVGKSIGISDLFEDGYEAIYIASGAGLPRFMNIPGEILVGVYSANEYLTRINLMKANEDGYDTPIIKSKNIAVVGGGNVAMDAARCAKRMGAENVYLIYRRSLKEMPARLEEVHHAQEEGIIFKTLINPVQIIGDEKNRVIGIECLEMELGEPDISGRRAPIPKENSNFVIDVDNVIMAIGTSPNPLLLQTTDGLSANKKGCIVVDETMQTSIEGVYAGGDTVKGAATVIYAMGTGKSAAASIDRYIIQKHSS